jgi:mRNA-degrading endonuclease RelE of RelBE toxin-antitoxin system
MKNKIYPFALFESRYKRFKKKFPTLEEELKGLEKELLENPRLGILITDNIYKIKVASSDKNKGKSGDFRVITYLVEEVDGYFEINLLTIYDKSEEATINKQALKKIVKKYF